MAKRQTRMFRWIPIFIMVAVLSACSQTKPSGEPELEQTKIGVMLSNTGLGDQSYSDAAFKGLIQARNEGSILFDYRELSQSKTYEEGIKQLIEEDNDLVIGLGFDVKESLEKVAAEYPDKQFLIIDETSELPNVASITFKEEEGSYLAGAVAGLVTQTDTVGFIGGVESAVLEKFRAGYEAGVQAVNPDAKVIMQYTGDFGKPELGAEAAGAMFREDADVIYAAAGLTGVGVLQEAEAQGKYAIGVDSDQFFVAEKAVVTSMVKNVDQAIHTAVQIFKENKGQFPQKNMIFGLAEKGVGLAPVRVIALDPEQEKTIDKLEEQLLSGSVTIKLPE